MRSRLQAGGLVLSFKEREDMTLILLFQGKVTAIANLERLTC